MDLLDFLRETQTEVRTQLSEGQPYAEMVFADTVMQHMAEIGMIFEPVLCYHRGQYRNAIFRLSGYALSDDQDQLDLFVSLYDGVDELVSVSDSDTKTAVEQCLRFLTLCVDGSLSQKLDPSSDVASLAGTLQAIYNSLEQVRIFVITDKVAKSKSFQTREISGKTIRLEVMDIERLHRHLSEGKPRDELVVDFNDVSGGPLPCIFVPGGVEDYGYALAAIPATALHMLYEKFGARLLEANVRSFLSVKGKGVNAGIQQTLRNDPGRFMAYNNGIVIVADELSLGRTSDGSVGISWIKGLQIVNGGQTTASIYFTKRKFPDTDITRVRVPAKIIVMHEQDPVKEESLVSDISRFANSQNAVRQSDLSANKPYHVEVEKLSLSVFCPDGVGRWFYERAAGSYNTMLARDGVTAAKLKKIKEDIPTARKITKTDLAKYLNAWNKKPDIVSLGNQKNFDRFMAEMTSTEHGEPQLPSVVEYKLMIAKTKLFRETQKFLRPRFQAFQANVTAYTISVVSELIGAQMDFDRIWTRQACSPELMHQIGIWAKEVNEVLHKTANGKMVSEWAKRPECRDAVLSSQFSRPIDGIPEFRV